MCCLKLQNPINKGSPENRGSVIFCPKPRFSTHFHDPEYLENTLKTLLNPFKASNKPQIGSKTKTT